MIDMFGIRTPSPDAPIGALSGGNVQRAVLARELDGDVEVLVVANPCFGLDVKALGRNPRPHRRRAQCRYRRAFDLGRPR